MKNRKRFWTVAGVAAAVTLVAAVLLILSASKRPERIERTIDTDKGTIEEEDRVKIVPGSRFTSTFGENAYFYTVDEDGQVYWYDGNLTKDGDRGRIPCTDEWFAELVRDVYPNSTSIAFDTSYWCHLLIDTGHYEEARELVDKADQKYSLLSAKVRENLLSWYHTDSYLTPAVRERLAALGSEPERKPRASFSELPEEKILVIEEAWNVLSSSPLYADRESKTFQPWLLYLGTYGDDCCVIRSTYAQYGPYSRITADYWEGYYLAGLLFPANAVSYYVYCDGLWMGLNTAYALGYLDRQALKEIAVDAYLYAGEADLAARDYFYGIH
ncbi:MAG: hypothetical protein ILP12_02080 [Lachnospiraceae bacterium]|nr:hypothetical protein [Lachnospiraceae bacterium]